MLSDDHTKQELTIDVGDGHTIYVQDWGNKDAEVPTIFLHGGPGSQVKDKHKSVFDPKTSAAVGAVLPLAHSKIIQPRHWSKTSRRLLIS
jgi:hypothetical protein